MTICPRAYRDRHSAWSRRRLPARAMHSIPQSAPRSAAAGLPRRRDPLSSCEAWVRHQFARCLAQVDPRMDPSAVPIRMFPAPASGVHVLAQSMSIQSASPPASASAAIVLPRPFGNPMHTSCNSRLGGGEAALLIWLLCPCVFACSTNNADTAENGRGEAIVRFADGRTVTLGWAYQTGTP
jgi:hypothetical protein